MAQGLEPWDRMNPTQPAAFIIVFQSFSKALFSEGNRSGFVQLQAGVLMSLDPSLWRDTAVTWA